MISSALRKMSNHSETAAVLVTLSTLDLFERLKSIPDLSERRQVTLEVYNERMKKFRKSPRYRSTMAQHLVDEVHPVFRRGFTKVLAASKDDKVNIDQFNHLNNNLHHHHELEDQMWFPQLRRQYREIRSGLDVLEADHVELVRMESEIRSGSHSALVEFVAALNDHLNREELLIIPCLIGEE